MRAGQSRAKSHPAGGDGPAGGGQVVLVPGEWNPTRDAALPAAPNLGGGWFVSSAPGDGCARGNAVNFVVRQNTRVCVCVCERELEGKERKERAGSCRPRCPTSKWFIGRQKLSCKRSRHPRRVGDQPSKAQGSPRGLQPPEP